MKPRLEIKVVPVPSEDAHRAQQGFLGVLADALADRLIAKARAEVAAELGVDESRIDREADRELAMGLTALGEVL